MAKKTAVLIVLDGWGIGKNDETNPLFVGKPQTFAWLAENYPITSLQASGIAVGLPWGEVGNSEVGHLTLGAGKVLYQYYPKIVMAIQDGTFFENETLKAACAHARDNNSAINFAGLLTKANVHASLDHLRALIKMAQQENVPKINLHLFGDGEDSPPHTLQKFLEEVPKEYVATLVGRYYAMDRNQNWRLTQTAYEAMVGTSGTLVQDPNPAIEATYKQGSTEEYLPALRLAEDKKISDGDSLVFFNFREDSMRQLASAFITKGFDHFPVQPFNNLSVATLTHYDDAFDVPVAFPADRVETPLGKVLSDAGLTQLRLAETYKYAHVTYFFNGLREEPFKGEYRTLVPSNMGPHPEAHPEMMAVPITDRLVEAIESRGFDFILVNYANSDTIAHTTDFNAALETIKVIDAQIARVVKAADNPDTFLFITSDHGHIDEMIKEATGEPESSHTPNPVPLYLVVQQFKGRRFVNADRLALETLGSLADVAPTILALMGLPKPDDMTGSSLLDGLI
ncbi:MAG TPA: 2,3-bisphosphoglycerate-independent phosphoglycerate mutase [Candidatus Paceibacterota bacterium]|nr:2,3-bisphosphoglycerate-independent phosphoglycerate mutase [Candidatus Paceibacterota bacterium]